MSQENEQNRFNQMLGSIGGNTIGMIIWMALWAEKTISLIIVLPSLLVFAGLTFVSIINYYDRESSGSTKIVIQQTSPFGIANAISFFLFLFVSDPLVEIVVFLIVIIFAYLITITSVRRGWIWFSDWS